MYKLTPPGQLCIHPTCLLPNIPCVQAPIIEISGRAQLPEDFLFALLDKDGAFELLGDVQPSVTDAWVAIYVSGCGLLHHVSLEHA